MAETSPRTKTPLNGARAQEDGGAPFLGLIDAVLVPDPVEFEFDGAVSRTHAAAAWKWMIRDIAPDLLDVGSGEDDPAARQALDAAIPELLTRVRGVLAEMDRDRELDRRMRVQMGGEAVYGRMPVILNALKCRNLLTKAQSFGRAANSMGDDAALALALQSMPLNDRAIAALLLQAAVGQLTNPARLMGAAIKIAGSSSEAAMHRAGLAPLVDAVLSHAQAQIAPLGQFGVYADVDLICRSIERFHRLMRAVTGFVELARLSHWSMVVAGLTSSISELIEPRLREVVPDVSRALRRREGHDRLDSDQLLIALNGCYVLAAVREARDSLALNALFDQAWNQLGQALEMHVQRNLEVFRQSPNDQTTAARLDAAIKMSELRFNTDYADVLRRARDSASKRAS
jgi:hypothetical protein